MSILKDTPVPILLLHGECDDTVTIENSLVNDKDLISKKENIKIIKYKDKYHNIYQTRESEKYLNNTFAEIAKANKKEFVHKLDDIYKNIDYKKITEEDKDVMDTIIEFLN